MPKQHPTKIVYYKVASTQLKAKAEKTHRINGSVGKVVVFTAEPDIAPDDALLAPGGTIEEVEVTRVRHRIDRATGKRRIYVTVRNNSDVECSYDLHGAFIEPAKESGFKIYWNKTMWTRHHKGSRDQVITKKVDGRDIIAEIALNTTWTAYETGHSSYACITQIVSEKGVENFPATDHQSASLVGIVSRDKVTSVTFKVHSFHTKTAARAVIYSKT